MGGAHILAFRIPQTKSGLGSREFLQPSGAAVYLAVYRFSAPKSTYKNTALRGGCRLTFEN